MQRNDKKHHGLIAPSYQVGKRLRSISEPEVSGWINYASWLSEDILLIVGWFHAEDNSLPRMFLSSENDDIPLQTRCMSYQRPNLPNSDVHAGKIVTARLPRTEETYESLGTVVVETGASTFRLGPLDLAHAITDLQTLTLGGFAWCKPETRTDIMDFLSLTPLEYGETTKSFRLSRNLLAIRDVLRERLPACVMAPDQSQGLHVDDLLALDERSFYLKGWVWDSEANVTRLTAVSPEGTRTELLERVFRYPRTDVGQFYDHSDDEMVTRTGFIGYINTKTPSHLTSGWIIEMRNAAGTAVEARCPVVVREPIKVRNSILAGLPLRILPNEVLMRDQIFPAISQVQKQLGNEVEVEDVIQYGLSPESPDVSIIIPLYKRIDFLEQQLAQFVHDPQICQADLIYVLDSPALASELKEAAAQLHQLYRVPFRTVILKRNVGYSAANNVGAYLARGRLLLLLNSDVLPHKPGWLGRMTAFYDSTPGIGALGPKLLYEDDSLQHAGMYFYLPGNTALAKLWQNLHYFKGLHRNLPAANVTRPVPAVTGACLMVAKGLYESIGGLQGIYLQGDHEDSDFCLRLIELGYENWYLPSAELYHLEAQSYSNSLRRLTALYNRWIHTRLWNTQIKAAMARYGSSAVTAPDLASEEDPNI